MQVVSLFSCIDIQLKQTNCDKMELDGLDWIKWKRFEKCAFCKGVFHSKSNSTTPRLDLEAVVHRSQFSNVCVITLWIQPCLRHHNDVNTIVQTAQYVNVTGFLSAELSIKMQYFNVRWGSWRRDGHSVSLARTKMMGQRSLHVLECTKHVTFCSRKVFWVTALDVRVPSFTPTAEDANMQ